MWWPLPACEGATKKTHMGVIIGAAIGGATLAALVVGVGMMFFMRKVVRKKKEEKIPIRINGPGASKELKRSSSQC
ncbi:hypothetical protein HanRHA438_Chr01g0021301 [Helianthus annuus]|nr:hypothetical protein HanRHA438_Chr01g0021301 [Helianthus annuus]